MAKVGIFFGTSSGTTRLMAKKMAKKLGAEVADKPLNVNRTDLENMLSYDFLILGTPSYGPGIAPGIETGVKDGSWQEFFPQLTDNCLQGKKVALYGLGDQDKYTDRFANGLRQLYDKVTECGATVVGGWSTEGYEFNESKAAIDGMFVGLVIDQTNQSLFTEDRLDNWLAALKPEMGV
jgi:flavodoxin I